MGADHLTTRQGMSREQRTGQCGATAIGGQVKCEAIRVDMNGRFKVDLLACLFRPAAAEGLADRHGLQALQGMGFACVCSWVCARVFAFKLTTVTLCQSCERVIVLRGAGHHAAGGTHEKSDWAGLA